jgi:hypothetical protein
MRVFLISSFLLWLSGCWIFNPGRKNDSPRPAAGAVFDQSRPIVISRTNYRSAAVVMAHTTLPAYCELYYWPQSLGERRPEEASKIACSESQHFSHQVVLDKLDPASVYWFELAFGSKPGAFTETRRVRESANDTTILTAVNEESNLVLSKINGSLGTLSVTSLKGYTGAIPKLSTGCYDKAIDLSALVGNSTPTKISWISMGGKKSENAAPQTFLAMKIPNNIALQKSAKVEFNMNGTTQSIDIPKAPILSQASMYSNTEISFNRVRLGNSTPVNFNIGESLSTRWQTQHLEGEAFIVFDARVENSIEGFSCVFEASSGAGVIPLERVKPLVNKNINFMVKLITYKAMATSANFHAIVGYEDFRRRVIQIK